jgi:hypothetical protein
MAGRQQLEISEVRSEDQRADTRILRLQRFPDIGAAVRDAIAQAAIEKSAHADVLGGGAAKIFVRGAQDTAALGLSFFRKRNLEILHPDFHVTPIESIEHQGASDAERIQHGVGQQADRVQRAQQHPIDHAILEAEFGLLTFADAAIQRKIRRIFGERRGEIRMICRIEGGRDG